MTPEAEAVLRARGWQGSLAGFAATASRRRWTAYRWSRHLARALERAATTPGSRLIVQAPPRHGKSELTSRWLPTWYLERSPTSRVILASYTADLATSWCEKVRNAFADTALLAQRVNPNHATAGDWQLKRGGGMRAVGVGGSITGFGGDLVLVDDPHKDWEEAMSPRMRRRVVDWFDSTLMTRLEPGASVVVVQTRWHEMDLAGVLEKRGGWKVLRLPALAEEDDALGRAPGEALCPERYSAEDLTRQRETIGEHKFAGLYQQHPRALEGTIVKDYQLKWYTDRELRLVKMVCAWDLTFSLTGTSWVVGQVWGRSAEGNLYLLDQVRRRMGFVEQVAAIKALRARWPQTQRVLVEEAANGHAALSTLKREVHGLVAIKPRSSKDVRLMAVAPLFEAGRVYLPHPSLAPWVEDYEDELLTFPGSADNDQVDATSMALADLEGSRGFACA